MEAKKQEIVSVSEKVFHSKLLVHKIIKNIPLKNRWSLASTDKRLYSIICDLDKNKHVLKLRREYIDDPTVFSSIIHSERKFDEMRIRGMRNENFNKLIKVASKHGSNVKKLSCFWNSDDAPHFQPFEATKLQEFFAKFSSLIGLTLITDGEVVTFESMIGECEAVLKTLKTIDLNDGYLDGTSRSVYEEFLPLIASDTIENFSNSSAVTYQSFIQRQRNIKKIYTPSILNAELYKHLKLEEVSSGSYNGTNEFLLQIFKDHGATLKKVYVSWYGIAMSADVAISLCERLGFLQKLSIRVTNENISSFIGLGRLKELESLRVSCSENFSHFNLLLAVTRLKMPSIKKLYVSTNNSGHDVDALMRNVGDNWENLEDFQIEQRHEIRNELPTSMNGILERARKLKALHFNFNMAQKEVRGIFEYNGQTYPLLERFTIGYCRDTSFLFELNIFPNLKYLGIECPYRGSSQLKQFLALNKLEELNIDFIVKCSLLTITDEEVSMIKKLCMKVKKFDLHFTCPLDSSIIDVLSAEMSNYVSRSSTSSNEKSLWMRSAKY